MRGQRRVARIGRPTAWFLTMRAGWGAAGAWWGLAASLTAVAILLTCRFLRRTRLTPEHAPRP